MYLGIFHPRKAVAKKYAALDACRQLFAFGVIDEHLKAEPEPDVREFRKDREKDDDDEDEEYDFDGMALKIKVRVFCKILLIKK